MRANVRVDDLFKVLCLGLFLSLVGCRGQTSEKTPIVPIRNMYNQPRYNPQATSPFFADGRTMRPQVVGAMAREMEVDATVATGRDLEDARWLTEVPEVVLQRQGGLESTVRRGQDRFAVYCSPCHAGSGNGQGTITRRLGAGPWTPPTLHSARLRHVPDGQIYATITNGIRSMPSYRHSIPGDDRWAIVAYVRALQLSQLARLQQEGKADENPGATP